MIGVTVGGVTIGLALLIWQWFCWWPGRSALLKKPAKHAAAILPFLLAWAYGALGTLTTMGLIGMAFDMALWASNWLGDAALWIGVGHPAGTTAAGAPIVLSGVGTCVVFLATVAIVAAIKFRPAIASDLKRGAWCGCCLGTSSTLAGMIAVPLAQATDWIGQTAYGVAL